MAKRPKKNLKKNILKTGKKLLEREKKTSIKEKKFLKKFQIQIKKQFLKQNPIGLKKLL